MEEMDSQAEGIVIISPGSRNKVNVLTKAQRSVGRKYKEWGKKHGIKTEREEGPKWGSGQRGACCYNGEQLVGQDIRQEAARSPGER